MSHSTPESLRFPPMSGLTIRGEFDGGPMSTDIGPLRLREVDRPVGLTERLAQAIEDCRHPSYVKHPLRDLLAHIPHPSDIGAAGFFSRRFVGYERYSGPIAGQTWAQLYATVRLYVNDFQPSFKLLEKTREVAKVTKRYNQPATPCDQLLAHPAIDPSVKAALQEQRARLDPIELLHHIRQAQAALAALSSPSPATGPGQESLEQFLQQRPTRWHLGEVRPTHVKHSTQPRLWRTRKDPFEDVGAEVLQWLQQDPDATAKSLFGLSLTPEVFRQKHLLLHPRTEFRLWAKRFFHSLYSYDHDRKSLRVPVVGCDEHWLPDSAGWLCAMARVALKSIAFRSPFNLVVTVIKARNGGNRGRRSITVEKKVHSTHSCVRAGGGTGWSSKKSSPEEGNKILEILDEGLRAGAIGVGSTLGYMRDGVTAREMFEVQKLASQYGWQTGVHFRYTPETATTEANGVEEILANGMVLDAPVLACHFNNPGWPLVHELLTRARSQGG